MHSASPRCYLIAATEIDRVGVERWLRSIGGLKVLDNISGTDGEQLVELAARRCYKSFDVGLNPNITKVRTDSEEYHDNILTQSHGSVLMHATCTFAFEDVSRVFTHEIVRNSTGNAFSQESMRYVRLTDMGFWLPPEIEQDEEATKKYIEVVEYLEKTQLWLADHFKIDKMTSFAQKKKLTSSFRRLAPDGVSTGIVVTFNTRSLRWVIEQRTHRSAEHEIRLLFGGAGDSMSSVFSIAKQNWPYLFSDFTQEEVDGVNECAPKYSKV